MSDNDFANIPIEREYTVKLRILDDIAFQNVLLMCGCSGHLPYSFSHLAKSLNTPYIVFKLWPQN